MTTVTAPARPRLIAAVVLTALFLTAVATGCSGSDDGGAASTANSAASVEPDLLGAWTGEYAFPTPDGGLFPSPLRIVVEKQEQGALWGYEEFEDSGQVIRIPLTGSLDADGVGFGFGATGLILDGELTGVDTMNVRFFKVSDPATSFDVELQRVNG
jgi:hypothetical protein